MSALLLLLILVVAMAQLVLEDRYQLWQRDQVQRRARRRMARELERLMLEKRLEQLVHRRHGRY